VSSRLTFHNSWKSQHWTWTFYWKWNWPIRPISRFLHEKGGNFDVSLYVCCLWWPNNFPSSTTPPPPQSPLSLSKPLVPQTTQQQFLKNKTGVVLLAPPKSPVCTKFGCYLRFGLSSSYQKFPASKLTFQLYFCWTKENFALDLLSIYHVLLPIRVSLPTM
jgi:hypothetical protein